MLVLSKSYGWCGGYVFVAFAVRFSVTYSPPRFPQTRDLLAVADTTESGGVTADVTTVRNSVAGEMGHPGGVVTENGDAEQTFLGETAVEEMEREVTVVMGEQANLRREVRQLNNVVTELHQRHHELTLKVL